MIHKLTFTTLGCMALALLLNVSCTSTSETMDKTLDIQGHRGARGLMPENTIPGFIEALNIGATTLELDLAVTKDHELLVSHEHYINATYCLDTTGAPISKEKEKEYNIYQMTYEEVKAYDCGIKPHPHFPQQKKFSVAKPLLKELVTAVNEYQTKNNKLVKYNIEIKCSPAGDNTYHPDPKVFSDLVYSFIQQHMDPKLVNVQSFDFRVLRYFHEKYPDIKLAVLVGSDHQVDNTLNDLGFTPPIYSCGYKKLTQEIVQDIQTRGMAVIPWTVNETKAMQQLIDFGVDGIITDYPDRLVNLMNKP